MPIFKKIKMIERKATVVPWWIGIDKSKLCSCFRGGGEVKKFLLKEIRAVVL